LTLKGKRRSHPRGAGYLRIGLAVAEAAKAEGSDVVVVSSKQSRVDAALTLLAGALKVMLRNLSDETAVYALFGKMGPFDHLV